MAITQNTYTGDGTTVLFTISFPYLEQDHVKASLNGTPTTAFTFANSNTIQFNVAPANGVTILLFRETESGALQNQFFPNSSIPSDSLNNNFTQGLYVAQETDNTSNQALSDAQNAVTTANGAVVTANAADAKSDQAIIDSAAAVVTANTAESNSIAAVSTANAASSAASAAVSTANAASSAASAAVITANAADATATQASIDASAAVVTANAADGKADSAIITANAADAAAAAAVITANAADANASAAVITANTAESNSLAAVSTANAAAAAVAAAQLYLPVADLTALALLTPADGDLFELTDSTGAETDPSITGVPIGLVGDAGLTFRLRYDDPPGEYAFVSYFANDSEGRYIRSGVGAIVNADVSASAAIGLSKLATGALPTGITVASANIVDGTIVNADISASAAIGLSKLATGALPTAITVASANIIDGTIVNADINASAAIADTKLATISTAGKVSNSATTATNANTASAIVARDASGNFSAGTITANLTGTASAIADNTVTSAKIVDGTILNADVNASAAIAGTKVAPDFGSQNVVTTGTATAASLNPTGSSVPTNGVYLPAANSVGISTNGTGRLFIASDGKTGLGTSNPQAILNLDRTDLGTDTWLRVSQSGTEVFSISQPSTSEIRFATPDLSTDREFTWHTRGTERLRINANGSLIVNSAAGTAAFTASIGGSEVARIDTSGRLLVGTSTARANFLNAATAPFFQLEGTATSTAAASIVQNFTNTLASAPARLILARSGATTLGSTTEVAADNVVGSLSFQGSDGTEFVEAATINAAVDGTPGANDMPGRLVFSTTADGASSPTERMRIDNKGATVCFGTSTTVIAARNSVAAGTATTNIAGVHSATGTGDGTVSFRVYTNGNVQNTNNSYGSLSDLKLKENIVTASSQWEDLKALQVRKYNFKEETGHETHTQIGLVAQEAELVSPGLVTESPDQDAAGNDLGTVTKSVNYSVLYMKAVKALQEAMERIETLEADVAALKAQ
jgi:hypothetical protein